MSLFKPALTRYFEKCGVSAHDAQRVEDEAEDDDRLVLLAGAAEHVVEQHDDHQQPFDFAHGA